MRRSPAASRLGKGSGCIGGDTKQLVKTNKLKTTAAQADNQRPQRLDRSLGTRSGVRLQAIVQGDDIAGLRRGDDAAQDSLRRGGNTIHAATAPCDHLVFGRQGGAGRVPGLESHRGAEKDRPSARLSEEKVICSGKLLTPIGLAAKNAIVAVIVGVIAKKMAGRINLAN